MLPGLMKEADAGGDVPNSKAVMLEEGLPPYEKGPGNFALRPLSDFAVSLKSSAEAMVFGGCSSEVT